MFTKGNEKYVIRYQDGEFWIQQSDDDDNEDHEITGTSVVVASDTDVKFRKQYNFWRKRSESI